MEFWHKMEGHFERAFYPKTGFHFWESAFGPLLSLLAGCREHDFANADALWLVIGVDNGTGNVVR